MLVFELGQPPATSPVDTLAAFAFIQAHKRLEEQRTREHSMTELAFSKTYLTTLDNKPTKYQPDHVFDPASFELRTPVLINSASGPFTPMLT